MRAFIPMVLLACLGDPVAVRGQQSAIKVVVPFPAGGPTDTATRLVSQALSAQLGRPVIVENQSGAGGTIAARQVAAAAADGATLLVAGVSTFCTAPFLYRLPYDPRQAFAPIGTMAVDQLALVVNSSLGPNTADALVSYA